MKIKGKSPSVAGFDQIRRRWDERENSVIAMLLPGELYVTKEDELISTVLGSCVAACIRDRVTGVGGMNHFMLPVTDHDMGEDGSNVASDANRFGSYAMENLINTILSNGGQRKNLEVKLFGGGKMFSLMSSVGEKNINFVLEFVKAEGLDLVAQDLGDIFPRKVVYYPLSGRVRMKRLKKDQSEQVINKEIEYRDSIKKKPVEGDIELF